MTRGWLAQEMQHMDRYINLCVLTVCLFAYFLFLFLNLTCGYLFTQVLVEFYAFFFLLLFFQKKI